MPFAVSQWPYSPDPRGPGYSVIGWNFGQVVSWKWLCESTDATGRYAFLNDGLIVESTFDDGATTTWGGSPAFPPSTVVSVVKIGLPAPGGAPTRTITFTFQIFTDPPPVIVQAVEIFTWPIAIQKFGPWTVRRLGVPVPEIPNGVTITPANWNA